MHDDLVLARPGCDALALCERSDDAAERVLQADHAGRARVDVVAEDGVGLHVFEREVIAVLGHDAFDERAAEGCHAAGFPLEDVAAVVGEDAVRRAEQVGADGDLVAHGAGADEQGGFFVGHFGDHGLEGVGCWVGAAVHDVVEEGCAGDGGEHAGGGRGDDVAWRSGRVSLRVIGGPFRGSMGGGGEKKAYCGNRRLLGLGGTSC